MRTRSGKKIPYMKGSKTKSRRSGQKRKREGMESTQSDSDAPTVEQEVHNAFEELNAAASMEGSTCALKQMCKAARCLVSLSDKQEEIVSPLILNDEKKLSMLVDMLQPSWYPELLKDDPLSSATTCISCVCQVLYDVAGVEEFRHGCNSFLQKNIVTNLVHLLEQPDPLSSVTSPQARRYVGAHVKEATDLHVDLLRDVCDTLCNVSREQKDTKKLICDLGGIDALVKLLDHVDPKLQRSATSVLRTLAFKEEVAKQMIVDSGAVPPLIRMLRSEDHQTHYEAVGTLGNLVHSSPDIKRRVLQDGVLQPVINLLSCTCRDSLREAALLIGQFAQGDPRRRGQARPEEDFRIRIVQRGAVQPLIAMLKMPDRALREMAAFALGRLAQNTDNQAGIFAMGVLSPLLDLLSSKIRNLEHNAAFTLYGLADNPDNVPEFVKQGGYEQLRQADFPDDQPTKDCIVKTLKRVADKVQSTDFIKEHLMSLLRSQSPIMRERMATSLAHLLRPEDVARAYSEFGGACELLDIACDLEAAEEAPARWGSAMAALREVVSVAKKREMDSSSSFVPAEPDKKVIIDKSYVNNPRVHDVVFVVEGEPFYAHKLALSASSEAFSAMFESSCREGNTAPGIPAITIPHISRPVFHAMMLFIYTGDPSAADAVSGAPTPELLQAADLYLLDKLKVKCAEDLARTLTVANVSEQFELATQFNATKLAHAAVAFCVTAHVEMEEAMGDGREGYVALLCHIRHILEEYLEANLRSEGSASGALRDLAAPKAVPIDLSD